MPGPMKVKFWGVRGSHPVPGEGTLRIGGNTACVEVVAGRQTIILDAGTGIIGLGREITARSKETGTSIDLYILFSHLHHDHTQGILFFSPALIPSAHLQIFGPGVPSGALREALARPMEPPSFPITLEEMASQKKFIQLQGGECFSLGGRVSEAASADAPQVSTLRSYAHPGGVLFYRIDWEGRSVVYATDTEGYIGVDRRLVQFAQEADILIHDAQYTDEHYRGTAAGRPSVQGFGHSTFEMACEVAQAAGVKKLILFHHDPTYDDAVITDIEAKARQRFPNTLAAFEGLEIILETVADVPAAAETLSQQSLLSDPLRAPAPARAAAGLPDPAVLHQWLSVRTRVHLPGQDRLPRRPS